MYPIERIDRLQSEDLEYLGSKRKFWFTQRGTRFLFKAEERGTGEDWAEKVVAELAGLLGIPHVEYTLAHEYEGRTAIQPGVICATIVPRPRALVLGNQLLLRRNPDYPSDDSKKYGVREYTVEAAADAVSLLDLPRDEWRNGMPGEIRTATGVFTGYLLLDAWTANQDRHHQNWGAIREDGRLSLAPSFDHGAALARNLTDEERKRRLETRDAGFSIASFAAKARSGFYATPDESRTMLAFDAFQCLSERESAAAGIWLGKLAGIDQNAVEAILKNIPPQRLTPVARDFTLKLLAINQRRLLDGRK